MNLLKRCQTYFIAATLALYALSCAADDKKEAVAMVKAAVDFMKKNGKDKLLENINAGHKDFRQGDVYAFVYALDGTTLAHPTNPKLVGKNLLNVPDPNGRLFRKEIIDTAIAKGSGWVDYKYLNPETRKIEEKTTYFEKAADVVIACGIYK